MTTEEQKKVEREFREELAALLTKYHVVLEAKDHYQGCPECGPDMRITAAGQGLYGAECEVLFPYFDIELSPYVTPQELLDGKA